MKKAFFALILLLNIFGNSIQLYLENERCQKIKSFVEELIVKLENQLPQYNQLNGISLQRTLLYEFFYHLFDRYFNEFLSVDFIQSISISFTDIYLQNPNDYIRKKKFAIEIIQKFINYILDENEEIGEERGDPYNSFCIFIMSLFGLGEEYCE